ncbi:MAG: HAD family hydrolase [Lachnospiraceae bacterium]|nr:HAD family hydrolase [Lachnospiraceae bacterium]
MKCNNLLVDKVYTSEMIQKYKPDKGFYQYILQCEGYEPKETVFIGDSLQDDIAGPKSVGITTVLVDRKKQFSPVASIQPDYIVGDIREILGWRES